MIILNRILLFIVLLSILFPENVHAYLDPGTGSYVLQIILAFVIGGLYTFKLYWVRIKAYLKRTFLEERKL
jgi:hypothetical protein